MIKTSIIILNYQGEKVIEETLNSVINSDFNKKEYEIIIVDNNSSDNSRQIILNLIKANKDVDIKLIQSEKNLGFSKGNNLGIRQAKGKYVILLNNDCIVSRQWLAELVESAEKTNNIFAVGSKLYLYPRFLEIFIDESQSIDSAYLSKSNLLRFSSKKIKLNIFKENNNLKLEIPIDYIHDKLVKFILEPHKTIKSVNKLKKLIGLALKQKNIDHSFKINKNKLEVEIIVNDKLRKLLVKKIQNFGNLIFQNGYGRDIGALVKNKTQDYEIDYGQYNTIKTRLSICGAAMLLNKEKLKDTGLLEESYFMYYEDNDICYKANLLNYKVIANPKAIAYHLHSYSSKEWSPFFIYNSEKSRLIFTFLNFPISVFIKEYIKFLTKALIRILLIIKNPNIAKTQIQYIKVALNIIFLMPSLFLKRRKRLSKIDKKILNNEYKKILSGYWLFN